MPARDLALLTDAAHAAADIARRFWKNAPEAWEKPQSAGPVTEADLAIDRMLHADLLAARPDYGWLSEETEDDTARLHHDRVFIIDPIDGTRAFIAGERQFAHAFAVADQGRITAAVVYLPMLDQLYAAIDGAPATCNGVVIHPTARATLDGAHVLASAPAFHTEHWKVTPQVKRHFRASLAYRLCLVADGSSDAMISFRDTWEWDAAAGDLILRMAGAVVTDRVGQPLRFNAPHPQVAGMITANPVLHGDIMGRVA